MQTPSTLATPVLPAMNFVQCATVICRLLPGLIAGIATLMALPAGAAEGSDAESGGAFLRFGSTNAAVELRPGSTSHLLLQQPVNEGYYRDEVDLEDPDAYFWHIFSRLPDEVTVYPSENYFYFIDFISGRQIWGNIRLPSGRRERGVLSFGYSEFVEFPSTPGTYVSRSKYFTDGDGMSIKQGADAFTWLVTYNKRTVTFHLHRLKQDPPRLFKLRSDEAFIERTFDESGIQFMLLFNTRSNYFFWVLNEEEKVPDTFTALDKDIVVGLRTGFAFWIDGEKPPRKVLASVRKISVTRNDYYDGPFDQLADNYVDQTRISYWMERAIPGIKGRIDKYGYYTDVERPSRVALSVYGTHYTQADIIDFVKKAKSSFDAYHYISRGGVPLPGQTWSGEAVGTNLAGFTGTNRAPPGTQSPVRTNAPNAALPGALPAKGAKEDKKP
jgi:hypothetical protein